MQILQNTNIDFLKLRNGAFVISLVLIIAGVTSLVLKKGPNLGIDFTGGSIVQVLFDKPQSLDSIRDVLNAEGFESISLQNFTNTNSVLIKIKQSENSSAAVGDRVQEILAESFSDNPFVMERVEFVGPVVGRHLVRKALMAIIFSMVGIILYVGFRFRSGVWGIAGVVALLHDVVIVLGLFSILNKEITLTVVAAFLTLAGYSVNDTIVIFDRIRENIRLMRKDSLEKIMNHSLNGTLSRTVMTSMTTLIVVLALLIFGGEVIHDFAFGLTAGIIVGTYSSLFIATPLVYIWQTRIEHTGRKNR
ncbi:MAG: protein translocase subunit SecF [Elusimicrobia bacterium]|nr:protein translocase subunit SecF [Elusimicrobiota bacterium]MBD3412723.1 protein translocase subunit SecF [Elusimicrobiota bacterium]